jgi:hypothetical protein
MPGGAQSQRQLTALIPAGARCRLSCGDDPKDLPLQDRALIAAIDRRHPERPGLGDRLENTRQPGGGAAPERSRFVTRS